MARSMNRMALVMMLLAGLLFNALPVAALAHGPMTTAAGRLATATAVVLHDQHHAASAAQQPCGDGCGGHHGDAVTHATCVACHALPAAMLHVIRLAQASGLPKDDAVARLSGHAPQVLVPPPRG